jgi:dolichol-phosphate mannosyltransferase
VKALVTGAGGFVGANLLRHLLTIGFDPIGLIRPGGDQWRLEELAGELPLLEVDLRDQQTVNKVVVGQRPELIFHLAAHGAYSWQSSLETMVAINVLCTETLLTAARSIGARLVCAGTSSEYGYKDHAPSELERTDPNSHYAITKAAGTQLSRLAAAEYGQHAVTLRLYYLYGPWENRRRLMPTLVEHALQGRWPRLAGPAIARDFVAVQDACTAFVAAASCDLDDPGEIFNIASGTQTTLAGLVETVRELFSVEPDPVWGTMPERAWDTATWVGDPSSAADTLSWQAETSLTHGLVRLADWLHERSSIVER